MLSKSPALNTLGNLLAALVAASVAVTAWAKLGPKPPTSTPGHAATPTAGNTKA